MEEKGWRKMFPAEGPARVQSYRCENMEQVKNCKELSEAREQCARVGGQQSSPQVLQGEWCPPKRYVEVLTPGSCECDLV